MNIKFHWLTGSGRSEMQSAKLRKNRSIRCGDIRFFDFSRWQPPPFWVFEIVDFYWHMQFEGSRCISVPNFDKIGQTVFQLLAWLSFGVVCVMLCLTVLTQYRRVTDGQTDRRQQHIYRTGEGHPVKMVVTHAFACTSFKFHQNRLNGYRAVRGRNLAHLIT